MQSIRSRLLAWLIGSVVLAGAIQAAVLYNVSLREANELFDYHMQQQALALRDQVMVLGDEEALVQADEDFEFVIQIWRADGERLYRSRPRSPLPQSAALGFADLATPDGLWRTFGVQSRGRVIQVAQRMNVRRGMAADAALRTLIPLAVTVPLLTAFADLVGCLGGMFIGMVELGIPPTAYLNQLRDAMTLSDVGTGLIKSAFFAALIGLVACQRGLQTRGGAQGVGASTTSAVVVVLFGLVALDAVFTMIFRLLGW